VAGVDALYVAPPEPVVALRFSFEYRSRPQFLASFRLENLPLPVDPPLTSAGQPRELSDPTRFAFYREKGAVLVSPVRLGDQPAPAGLLLLGLQRLGLSSPETVRWIELPIENGEARFPGLAPGKYRVLRRYKPFGNLSNAPGRWVDAELKITVPGSGTAPLPPLRLVKQP
jgi:hypothetical protein